MIICVFFGAFNWIPKIHFPSFHMYCSINGNAVYFSARVSCLLFSFRLVSKGLVGLSLIMQCT